MKTSAHDEIQSPLLQAQDESFWRSLNPDLHITPQPLLDLHSRAEIDALLLSRSSARMNKEGYFQTPPRIARHTAVRLARVVTNLSEKNIPPIFAFVYDEFWQLIEALHPFARALLGDKYELTPTDVWGWHIPTTSSAAGWGPHRDLRTTDTLREDNTPLVLTTWIPLTDATPLNGCMYAVPMNLDPNLPNGLPGPDTKSISFQNIRALPADAGSILGWNTRTLHWGGRSSEWAEQPRISVAFYFHSRDFRLADADPVDRRGGFTGLTIEKDLELPFARRLRSIAGAILLYAGRIEADFPEVCGHLLSFAEMQIERCE